MKTMFLTKNHKKNRPSFRNQSRRTRAAAACLEEPIPQGIRASHKKYP